MPEAPAPWPPASGALVFAIVGAESTGKSTLAHALCARLADATGLHCVAVGEVLREWCDAQGRTPRRHEQAPIAAEQARRIAAAAGHADLVVCDTTPLMTAVYSRLIFDDRTLEPSAATWQRGCTHTLLTALDLPWQADGLQRDGPQVRAPVDAALRKLLIGHGLGFSVVAGSQGHRVEAALDAVSPWVRGQPSPRNGLFTRLQGRRAEEGNGRWCCELCDSPEHDRLAAAARPAAAAGHLASGTHATGRHAPGCPAQPGLLQQR